MSLAVVAVGTVLHSVLLSQACVPRAQSVAADTQVTIVDGSETEERPERWCRCRVGVFLATVVVRQQ